MLQAGHAIRDHSVRKTRNITIISSIDLNVTRQWAVAAAAAAAPTQSGWRYFCSARHVIDAAISSCVLSDPVK